MFGFKKRRLEAIRALRELDEGSRSPAEDLSKRDIALLIEATVAVASAGIDYRTIQARAAADGTSFNEALKAIYREVRVGVLA